MTAQSYLIVTPTRLGVLLWGIASLFSSPIHTWSPLYFEQT